MSRFKYFLKNLENYILSEIHEKNLLKLIFNSILNKIFTEKITSNRFFIFFKNLIIKIKNFDFNKYIVLYFNLKNSYKQSFLNKLLYIYNKLRFYILNLLEIKAFKVFILLLLLFLLPLLTYIVFFKLYNILNTIPVFFFFEIFFFFTTLVSFFFLSFLGLYGVFYLNLISLFLFFISTIFYFKQFFFNNVVYKIVISKWVILNYNFIINFSFVFDLVSFSFMFLTLSIGFFVYIYAFSYFRYEPLVERFILLLNSFMISMIFLVTSSNFIMLFLGWELIGLTSFFLINFWTTRVSTLKAAFKAFFFNKFSDFFLFFSILIIFNFFYDFDILNFNSNIHLFKNLSLNFFLININYLELTSILLLLCSCIKSAQFGFHIWLPDSMEAPVPASALIHSATLVSAGIFLILRLSPLFELSYFFYFFIPLIGSFTAFYGGFIAMFTSDVKRILAYSTISHCGFLMVLCSTFYQEAVILYLYVHGFFKASVFLCVGNVIRFSKNYQDFRFMGNFYNYLPLDCFLSFICLFNLAGLPFSFGFYVKHFLFITLKSYFLLFYFCYFFCLIGALSGLVYSYRLFYNVFFEVKKGKKNIYIFNQNLFFFNKNFSLNSFLADISIIFLIIFSYSVIFTILFNFVNLNFFLSDFNFNLSLSNFNNFSFSSFDLLFNLSFFNYIFFFIIIVIIFFNGRYIYNSYLNYYLYIIYFILFFFNYNYVL
uniref:NADH dehydrogenase subunit 5 n=1 Tax=Cryptocaryon irritans TaxID=153251 RepID=UPI0022FD79AF|nr:NADH dehydrogenase subunit 5 [Cryptocaryon irritans]WBP62334.1 NADH dehydrogenase subunit 5 [Cryptocaryon irritans]